MWFIGYSAGFMRANFQQDYVKGKAVPLQAWTGPEGSRKLRLPDFVTTAQDGGRLLALRKQCYVVPSNETPPYVCLYVYICIYSVWGGCIVLLSTVWMHE